MSGLINKIYIGDALTILKTWPDEFVDCVVTSPPYWGLRDYGIEGQLGLEKTPEEYVAKMVEVFREVKMVLKKEGTLWLNLGDSYAGSMKGSGGNDPERSCKQVSNPGSYFGDQVDNARKFDSGLKPKDLVGIPWRVAFALQADGWYLRSDIIWSKPNPMPESVRDRPTKAHEYIFLLSKSQKYYFDQDAVREPHARLWDETNAGSWSHPVPTKEHGKSGYAHSGDYPLPNPSGRNIRTVWNIATQPYSGAHFATFPEEIPERCIKAGTSEKGCCPKCGKAWVRVVKLGNIQTQGGGYIRHEGSSNKLTSGEVKTVMTQREHKTLGWQPSCSCGEESVPCVVLDPFIGSGTVAKVAIRLRRQWVGIDINPAYGELAEKRKAWTQVEMG